MESKQGLNNVQRKMLDEIYTEQFEALAKPILQERAEGLKRLKLEVLKEEMEKKPVKDVLAKLTAARDAYQSASSYLLEHGLRISGYSRSSRDEDQLEFASSYDSVRHPKIAKYEQETRVIEERLATKKKEIRARVYGMDTTYAEVEKEITKELESITN